MRNLLYFLIGLMVSASCEKDIPEIGFRIKSTGFFLEDGGVDPGDSMPSFSHKLSGGIVSFTSGLKSYDFRTGKISIEDFLFELPAGSYKMEFNIPEASLYGQKGGSFLAQPSEVSISETMEPEITVNVQANCALLLVRDEMQELDHGISLIERFASGEGYFRSYPLTLDSVSGLYYAYFTPDTASTNLSAYLWLYKGKPGIESGGLTTSYFEKGYQYLIKVLD
jgi:hypothetical protein